MKMKSLITIILALNCLTGFSQENDTLELIQGDWNFQQMCIVGDTTIKTKNFHATELTIENTKFRIGLSEAYTGGAIESVNNKLTGKYKYGDQVFDEMNIQKVNKRRITLRLTTSAPEYWTGIYSQRITIYLKYKK